MEGNEKIEIVQPDLSHRNQVGEVVQGFEIGRWSVWAKRHDQRGREEVQIRTEVLDAITIFEIRETNIFRNISESWFIIDQFGDTYDIQSVSRLRRHNNRYRILLLYAKRRQSL